MDKIERVFKDIQAFYKKNANPEIVKKYAKFFREGYDAYGIDTQIYANKVDQLYSEIEMDFKLSDLKHLFKMLLESNKFEEVSTVINLLSRMRIYYSKTLFKDIMKWLAKYFHNWAHVDIASNIVLSKFILEGVISHDDLLAYHKHDTKWVRRAIAVTTVYVFYTDKKLPPVLKAGNLLVDDPVREVGQGVGWMLRDAWKVYPEKIEKFLTKHVRTGNRTAKISVDGPSSKGGECEKMDKEYRKKFRRPK